MDFTPTDRQKMPPRTMEVGRAGMRRYGGYVHEEWLSELQGTEGAKRFREMVDTEPVLAATLLVFELLLRQTDVWVQRAGDDAESHIAAWEVQTALDDVKGGWDALLSNALSMLTYGYSLVEVVYKLRHGPDAPGPFKSKYVDGKWGWSKLAPRSQNSVEQWDFDGDSDDVRGVWQRSTSDYKLRYLPMDKLLHFRLRPQKDNPEGYALIRPAYSSYFYAKQLRFTEAVGIERTVAGMPTMEVPLDVFFSGGDDETTIKNEIKDFLRDIRQDEQLGALLPSELDDKGQPTGYRFRLLSAGSTTNIDVDRIIRRYESRMAMSVLTEVMLLGQDGMGSYALSKDKTELFTVGLSAILECILQEVNERLIPPLVRLNGHAQECAPTLEHGVVKAPNLGDLAAYIGAISGAGLLTPDTATEKQARKLIDLPEPSGPTLGLQARRQMAQPGTQMGLFDAQY